MRATTIIAAVLAISLLVFCNHASAQQISGSVILTEEDVTLNELHVVADVFFERKATAKIDTVRVKKFGIRKFKISRFKEVLSASLIFEDTFRLLKVNKQWEWEPYGWDWHRSDMYQHIYNHIGYPESAARNGISGRVFVGFKIDSEGNVKDVELRRGLDESIDEDILSVIRSMPKLTACEMKRLKGPVSDKAGFVLPVRFRITQVGSRQPVSTVATAPEDTAVYIIVDEMPLFDGRSPEESFREYVFKNIRNPAPQDDCWGRVVMEFVIEKDGAVSNARVLQSRHPALDAEALRVIRSSSGKWTPGKLFGTPVRVKYLWPVVFNR